MEMIQQSLSTLIDTATKEKQYKVTG